MGEIKLECIELEQDKSEQQIPKDMLNELYQSKVRGFPFFKYTGIKWLVKKIVIDIQRKSS